MSSFVEGLAMGLKAGGAVIAFGAVAGVMLMVVSMIVWVCDAYKEDSGDDGDEGEE